MVENLEFMCFCDHALPKESENKMVTGQMRGRNPETMRPQVQRGV